MTPRDTTARTALRKHVDFFDADGNGRITLTETYRGFRRLGFDPVRSGVFASVIHLALGPKTSGSLTLTIDAQRIHLGKHASDTGIFDSLGRFSAVSFNRRFDENDEDRDGALTANELSRMLARRRTDWVGHLASKAEFGLLFRLAGVMRGGQKVLTRERLESFYEGSLLYQLAEQQATRRSRAPLQTPSTVTHPGRPIHEEA